MSPRFRNAFAEDIDTQKKMKATYPKAAANLKTSLEAVVLSPTNFFQNLISVLTAVNEFFIAVDLWYKTYEADPGLKYEVLLPSIANVVLIINSDLIPKLTVIFGDLGDDDVAGDGGDVSQVLNARFKEFFKSAEIELKLTGIFEVEG